MTVQINTFPIKTFSHRFFPAKNKSPDKLMPEKLMIVMHGLGDSAEGYSWMPREFGIDDMNYLLLDAPDDYYGGFSWYDLTGGDQGIGIKRSRNLLLELLTELESLGWATEQIFLLGFSQGCVMCLDLGLRHNKKLAGICGISGYLFKEGEDHEFMTEINRQAFNQNWLITHGRFDERVPYLITENQMKELQSFGLPIRFEIFDKTHTIDSAKELPKIREWILG